MDFEQKALYEVQIVVEDAAADARVVSNVTLRIEDVNEAPKNVTLSRNKASSSVVVRPNS